MKAILVRVGIIVVSMLLLVGCVHVPIDTKGDDGFYQWGKGRTDWTTRY